MRIISHRKSGELFAKRIDETRQKEAITMKPFVNMIRDKRLNKPMTSDEIYYMIENYTNGTIPDYQMSAMLMAICINGMNDEEISAMTLAMRDSGEINDLSAVSGIKVDKHSTGGVGDKTTLVLCPLVAACGVKVAKLSGRGLGFTGGTIDKLAAIPGFSTSLSNEEFLATLDKTGACINAQTLDLAPADKKIYALRDVTGTVESIPLIAASIMSKKLASGADAIVLDVTTGSGAFMKTKEGSLELAKKMVAIGKSAGKKCIARITSMEEPLGYAVGNTLEVIEAINTLKNRGPKDLKDVCLCLGAHVISLGLGISYDEAHSLANDALKTGKAYEKFLEIVESQGGNTDYIKDISLFERAKYTKDILAPSDGYIAAIDAEKVGFCSVILGAGRQTKEDSIDLTAGIMLNKKVCDHVNKGDIIATLHCGDSTKLEAGCELFNQAFTLSEDKPSQIELIQDLIE